MRPLRNLIIFLMLLFVPAALLDAKGTSPRASRPYYGGGHHTTPHGGKYSGGSGSNDKGWALPEPENE